MRRVERPGEDDGRLLVSLATRGALRGHRPRMGEDLREEYAVDQDGNGDDDRDQRREEEEREEGHVASASQSPASARCGRGGAGGAEGQSAAAFLKEGEGTTNPS